jgi:antirestriction protein ArdC
MGHPYFLLVLRRVQTGRSIPQQPITSSFHPKAYSEGHQNGAATALHETSHWTGHACRLNRDEGMKARYGSAVYAMEELRAEWATKFAYS